MDAACELCDYALYLWPSDTITVIECPSCHEPYAAVAHEELVTIHRVRTLTQDSQRILARMREGQHVDDAEFIELFLEVTEEEVR